MFDAINAMLLDMLAAVARKDYDGRRRRQSRASRGRSRRSEDTKRNAGIAANAARRHLLVGNSRRGWMRPGDDRQGRQASAPAA
jgi:hypothetical protein